MDALDQACDCLARGAAAEAVALLRRALDEGRGGVLARITLGRALLAQGNTDEALGVLREAAQLAPGAADAALALAEALFAGGHLPTAIAEAQRALRLDPDHPGARFFLGCCWLEAGEARKALDIFSMLECAAGDKWSEELRQKIAQAEAMLAAPRAPAGYVRHLFDQFSADYNRRMNQELNYRAPAILRELWDMIGGGKRDLDILDLGCGTGLAGIAFNDVARAITGVDLSPRMIERAKATGTYTKLSIADLENTLAANGLDFDLVLAADTLVYLGDLAPTFAGVSRRMKPDGLFLFTVEAKNGEGFELGPKRRWRHSECYLRSAAGATALEVRGFLACSPRTEAREPVPGFAVALARASVL
ncbi:MAG: tetratricopeptide repeat protein [Alphaproteobacteria bacterium]